MGPKPFLTVCGCSSRERKLKNLPAAQNRLFTDFVVLVHGRCSKN